MSDLKTQRNVAVAVAALAVAFAGGYLLSGGRQAPETSVAAVAAPASDSGGHGARAIVPAAATISEAPAAASATPSRAAEPVAGQRRSNPAATRPSVDAEASAERSGGAVAALPTAGEQAPASAPVRRVERLTIPQSTPIVLTLVTPASSQSSQAGDEVVAELDEPIRVDGEIVVPAGTRVTGRVTEAQALRKVGGKAILGLAFDRLESGDGGAEIAAAFRREGKSETGKDAATIAAGAAIGTILGNQAKSNDRGKVIGAVLGAAAGTAVASKTAGETIDLPAGARLELTLRSDVEVVVDR